jgi:hypothetical protein
VIPSLIGVKMVVVVAFPLLSSVILHSKYLIVVMVRARRYDDCFWFYYLQSFLYSLESLFLTLRCFGHPVSGKTSVVLTADRKKKISFHVVSINRNSYSYVENRTCGRGVTLEEAILTKF